MDQTRRQGLPLPLLGWRLFGAERSTPLTPVEVAPPQPANGVDQFGEDRNRRSGEKFNHAYRLHASRELCETDNYDVALPRDLLGGFCFSSRSASSSDWRAIKIRRAGTAGVVLQPFSPRIRARTKRERKHISYCSKRFSRFFAGIPNRKSRCPNGVVPTYTARRAGGQIATAGSAAHSQRTAELGRHQFNGPRDV